MPDITVTVSDHFVTSINFLKDNNNISNITQDTGSFSVESYVQEKVSEMCGDVCTQAKAVKNIMIQRSFPSLSTQDQITMLQSMNIPTGSAYI